MAIIALLTDRPARDALPALEALGRDLKTEPLSVRSLEHVAALTPEAVFVDAAENPGQGHAVLRAMAARPGAPVIAVVERVDLERFAWDEVAEDLVFPGAPEAELRLRLGCSAGGTAGATAA
jgi:hypothetical protein